MATAHTKVVAVEYFTLTNPGAMANFLNRALDLGWRGSVAAWPNPDGSGDPVWQLTLDPVTQGTAQPIVASIDEVMVWDGTTLKHLDQTTFAANYTVG